jgi:hypothetical protein
MRLDPNPLFRRIIMPWYDSTLLCWGLLFAMVILMLFSLAGISVANEIDRYRPYVWLPWLLFGLSLFVGGSVAVRLLRRQDRQKDQGA